jgi:hypothetical protein
MTKDINKREKAVSEIVCVKMKGNDGPGIASSSCREINSDKNCISHGFTNTKEHFL